MNWWLIGVIVWTVLSLIAWTFIRIGALADRRVERWKGEPE